MVFHLVKLAVGATSIDSLAEWQQQYLASRRAHGQPSELVHLTRQTPRREGLEAGASSLDWVIGGYIRARQRILELRQVQDTDGLTKCAIVYDKTVIATEPHPRRPFQGWRYLPALEAPADLSQSAEGTLSSLSASNLSPKMHEELRALCLL